MTTIRVGPKLTTSVVALARYALAGLALLLAMPAVADAAKSPPFQSTGAARPPAAGMAMPSGSLPSIVSLGSRSELYGVTCNSPPDCWAVGFDITSAAATLGQALHFDGTQWSPVSVPEPGGRSAFDYNYLNAVACASSSYCWAVGYYRNQAMALVNEALRWNGNRWIQFSTPQPAGTTGRAHQNRLNGVGCISKFDCWAVGDYTNTAGADLNEALHWNGRKWVAVTMPDPNGVANGDASVPYGVSCTSRLHCLSVGEGLNSKGAYVNEALRWNGKTWTGVPTPQPGGTRSHGFGYLQGLACPAPAHCFADGGYKNSAGAYVNEVLRWNGVEWKRMTAPQPGGSRSGDHNQLAALTCTSVSYCWAVGYHDNFRDAELNEALAWNGRKWSAVSTPQPNGTGHNSVGNTLYGVSCALPSDCWAVGYTFLTTGRSRNQALLWDGNSWSAG